MASYWKSHPRKFCEVCKCWIGDNKASIDFHERGKSHQEKKKRQIEQIKKNSTKQHAINQRADEYLQKMNSAAISQYRKDLLAQGKSLPAHLEPAKPKVENTELPQPPIAKPKKRKTDEYPIPTPVVSTTSSSYKKTTTNNGGHPYGKWETVEKPSVPDEIETPVYVAETTKPAIINFEEKTVSKISTDSEIVGFKKRKVNSTKKNRNIRRKDDS